MSRRSTNPKPHSAELTDDEVIAIVSEALPHWKKACDNTGADSVIFHQMAFGRSLDEIYLLHAAVRYAGIMGKSVTIIP